LVRLHPRKVQIDEDETGDPVFSVTPRGGGKKILPRRDVVFVPFAMQQDGVRPISAVQIGKEAIALGIVLETMEANFTKRGMRPSGFVHVPKEIGGKALDNIREILKQQFQGAGNTGHVPLLSGGAEFKQLEIKLADQQFISLREFQISEICRVLSLTPTMLMQFTRATYSNSESMGLQFLQTCLASWAQKFEEALSVALIPMDQREKLFVDADFNGLAKVDLSARANAYAQFRSAGILSANECRAMEGRGPVPGGDSYDNPFTSTGPKNSKKNEA
jgi:HK97 family phage portal protein